MSIRQVSKYWPVVAFIMVSVLLIGAILYYAPAWGLQDDFQNLNWAQAVWQSENFLGGLRSIIVRDFLNWGMFRPVYYTAVVFTYHIFENSPWLIYIFIAIFNLTAILIWGVVIAKLFSVRKGNIWLSIFLFPLSFFIFTPFWNIFVHISFQEKLIVFFSALSLYFLEKAYSKDRAAFLIPVMLSIVLGILSKPTGIHLAMAYIIFAVIDLVFVKYKKRISLWVLLLNVLIFSSYYWFISSNLRGYTGRYSLTLTSVINGLFSSSMLIKFLMAFALIMIFSAVTIVLRRKNNFSPLAMIFPLGFLSHILVLAPWSFANYLLSSLTPYILAMFFPIYLWFNYKNNLLKSSANFCLVVLIAMSFFFIAIPRISKLAEIRKVEEFIVSFNKNNDMYFFPPPFQEAAMAVGVFTSAEITYLKDGILTAEKLRDKKGNYLLFNDESSRMTLDGVKVDKLVYKNNTWRIFHLVEADGNKKFVDVSFPQNPVQKVKLFLRDLR